MDCDVRGFAPLFAIQSHLHFPANTLFYESVQFVIAIYHQILVTYYNYYDSARDCEVKDGFFKETKSMTSNKELTEQKINELTIKVQLYLKTEWNRVKYESSGMKYERETVEFDYLELKEKIKCPDYHNRKWKRFWINIRSKAVRIIATPKVIIMLLIAAVAIIACFKYINLILISVTT